MNYLRLCIYLLMIIASTTTSIVTANEAHHISSKNTANNNYSNNDGNNFSTYKSCENVMSAMLNPMFSVMHTGMKASGMHTGMMAIMHGPNNKMQSMHSQHHISESIDPNSLPEPDTMGAKAFGNNCAQCHALPAPLAKSRDEWPKVVDRMLNYMSAQNRPQPTKQELREIITYLQNQGNPSDEVIAMPTE